VSIRTWTLANSVVVGAACPLEIDAEFSVGRAVFAANEDPASFLLQRSSDRDGTILGGDYLTSEEWAGLQDADEALSIPPRAVARPVVVWVFRSAKRDHWWTSNLAELGQLGALAHVDAPRIRGTRICLVYPAAAGTARDLWAQSSSEDAWRALLAGGRLEALRYARRAFCLAPRLYERDAAMLAVTYSLAGKHEDSEGVLAMAKRSKGETFFAAILARRERLLADLQASQARPTGTVARTARSRSAFDQVALAGLREWSQNHETPST